MVSLPRKAASLLIKDDAVRACEARRRQGVAFHTGNRTKQKVLAQTLLTIMHIIHTDIKRNISVKAFTIDHTTRSSMDTTAWSHHQSYMAVLTIALLDEFADVFHDQQLRFISLGCVAATYILHHDVSRVDLGLDKPLNHFTPKELRVHFCLKEIDFDHQAQGLPHDLYGIIPRYHPFASVESVQAEVNEGVLIDPPSSQSTQPDRYLLVMVTFILIRSARRLKLVRFHLSFDITSILVLSSLRYVDTLILRDCYHCAVQGTWEQFFNRIYALKAQGTVCTLTKLKVITSDPFSCSRYQRLYSSSKWVEALGLRDAVLKEVVEGDPLPERRDVFGYAILHILADAWEPDGFTTRARLKSGEDQTAYDRLVALLQQSQPDGIKEVI
ncbi:hypothetical protein KEM56_000947 [Ascosphaera pollenicola]|nr:hypothetical protein KEM56_000947 [Ascosphaera pollenicola]